MFIGVTDADRQLAHWRSRARSGNCRSGRLESCAINQDARLQAHATMGHRRMIEAVRWRLRNMRTGLWQLSVRGLSTGPHITRYAMYKRLREVGARLPSHRGSVLSI